MCTGQVALAKSSTWPLAHGTASDTYQLPGTVLLATEMHFELTTRYCGTVTPLVASMASTALMVWPAKRMPCIASPAAVAGAEVSYCSPGLAARPKVSMA